MGTLNEDVLASASWISAALRSSGYNADFSFASICEVERFFREQTKNGKASPSGLLSEDLGSRIFAIGSYCGEVLRRELGGAWIIDDTDPEGEINAALQLENGSLCWPIQRAMKRLQSTEENIEHWALWLKQRHISGDNQAK
jgi:hypothetical protein